MSLNERINIKLVRSSEIRLMHNVPKTWTEFQAALKTMYGSSDFQITYIDEESDHITVANDLDLSEALTFASSKPSLKLFLKPITIVEDFEELKIEDTPKPSLPEPAETPNAWSEQCPWRGGWKRGRGRWGGFGMHKGGFCKGLKKKMKQFMKLHKNKFLKLKVLHKNFPKHWVVATGSSIVISWSVMNKGQNAWPERSYLMDLGGELKLNEPVFLAEVKPGEVVNVCVPVTVPLEEGKFVGKWAVMVGEECAGYLKAKVHTTAESIDSKVLTIVSMGFSKEMAEGALRENAGDLNLAVSSILKSFSS